MIYNKCVCCGLELPRSVLTPIQVKYQGKIITVPICDICKSNKEAEAQRRQKDDKIN